MTNVLGMAAFQLGYPVARIVEFEGDDLAIHRVTATTDQRGVPMSSDWRSQGKRADDYRLSR
jgi:hypothetical protein